MPIILLPLGQPATANDEYQLAEKLQPGTEAIYQASGAFGGGTVVLGYIDEDGTITDYPEGSLTAPGGLRVDVPASGYLAATITGATAPSIALTATKARAAS